MVQFISPIAPFAGMPSIVVILLGVTYLFTKVVKEIIAIPINHNTNKSQLQQLNSRL